MAALRRAAIFELMLRGFGVVRQFVVGLAIFPVGCFIGYDSRWGQQKLAQQHLAAARTPTTLTPSADASASRPSELRTLRIRLEPTATHTAQVIDYERHFERLLAVANGVLESSLAVHLEISDTRRFQPASGEDHIGDLLGELARSDAGEDVDWVIGLAGSVPRFENSYHELGMGEVVGKHIVLRALNDVAEYRAIKDGLPDLSAAERDRLVRIRIEHKAAAVLLHELGHTLGALHELDKTNLMNPGYSTSAQHFGEQTLDVMRAVLAHRTASGGLDVAGKQAVVELWRREPAPWVPAERARELARFEARAPVPSASSMPATVPAELAPTDGSAFQEATRLLANGDAAGAFQTGKPLFDAYPNVRPVQELRCNIALRRGLPWQQARQECADLMPGTFGSE
jgi:hypothetical protein